MVPPQAPGAGRWGCSRALFGGTVEWRPHPWGFFCLEVSQRDTISAPGPLRVGPVPLEREPSPGQLGWVRGPGALPTDWAQVPLHGLPSGRRGGEGRPGAGPCAVRPPPAPWSPSSAPAALSSDRTWLGRPGPALPGGAGRGHGAQPSPGESGVACWEGSLTTACLGPWAPRDRSSTPGGSLSMPLLTGQTTCPVHRGPGGGQAPSAPGFVCKLGVGVGVDPAHSKATSS